LALCLWFLLFERAVFLYCQLPNRLQDYQQPWRLEVLSPWQQAQLNKAYLLDVKLASERFLSTIKLMIALCPLFGLLGTVSGMVSVFDVIALTGSSDAKAMAAGIFKATLPTMAGLFLALSALYFHYLLLQKSKSLQALAQARLTHPSVDLRAVS